MSKSVTKRKQDIANGEATPRSEAEDAREAAGREANALSLGYLESLYLAFLRDPQSVPAEWHSTLRTLAGTQGNVDASMPRLEPRFKPQSIFHGNGHQLIGNGEGGAVAAPSASDETATAQLQHRLDQLIRNYRVRGHIIARLDPLGQPHPQPVELDPTAAGFSQADLTRRFTFDTGDESEGGAGQRTLTLQQILSLLRNTYCRSIGVQFMHIDDLAIRRWLQARMEGTENRIEVPHDRQRRIVKRLSDAAAFEQFIQRHYIGAKSFSLEGAETLIPLLDLAIDKASTQGVRQLVLAMPHRGRLNVLANIMRKPLADIFAEFEGHDPTATPGAGDVKYHKGYSHDWQTIQDKEVHLSLCFNPSHLEFINPVALGRVRAKQDRVGDAKRRRSMAIMIHGDAAFAGEGIVQELLNLSQLPAYFTGGTLHVIVNNQIGFTTGPSEGRSTPYCTDVARMLQSPIFHVNGEDPEAVMRVVDLAMDFRDKFRRDVIVDMYCYRRRGHNEGDEPAFTQPVLYKAVRQRPPVRDSYLKHLVELGDVDEAEAKAFHEAYGRELEEALAEAKKRTEQVDESAETVNNPVVEDHHQYKACWSPYTGQANPQSVETQPGVDKARLVELLERLTTLPEGFTVHRKLEKFLEHRRAMGRGEAGLDWAAAEALALASLAAQGVPIRMTGQDSARGTFSQRHAVLHDHEDGHPFMPLAHVDAQQARVEIANSPLSEAAVLGYEYGYSLDMPEGLVLWEAQFGDFVNAAQVIIDQFITSGQDKWNRLSGLTLLLPHGFEGQGPEHSSARLERWLVLGAEENIQVVNPTTPAQYFHLLRRQVLRPLRKPLVVMTPKSLLRHERVTSTLDELSAGHFAHVLGDETVKDASKVTRVLMCSGKIYYDLLAAREEGKREDVAIIRLEQLYPLPLEELTQAVKKYPAEATVLWVQEEPRNMGAWPYLAATLACDRRFDCRHLGCVSRRESASPATGSSTMHKREQQAILDNALGRVEQTNRK